MQEDNRLSQRAAKRSFDERIRSNISWDATLFEVSNEDHVGAADHVQISDQKAPFPLRGLFDIQRLPFDEALLRTGVTTSAPPARSARASPSISSIKVMDPQTATFMPALYLRLWRGAALQDRGVRNVRSWAMPSRPLEPLPGLLSAATSGNIGRSMFVRR